MEARMASDLEKALQARNKFLKKWQWQIFGGVFVTLLFYVGATEMGWLVSHFNPPMVVVVFFAVAVGLFVIRERWLATYGLAELGIAGVAVYYVVRHVPENLNDPDTYILFVTQVAAPIYLAVRAIDNLWKSGVIKDSFRMGALGHLLTEEEPK
jgi:hypothetical protein